MKITDRNLEARITARIKSLLEQGVLKPKDIYLQLKTEMPEMTNPAYSIVTRACYWKRRLGLMTDQKNVKVAPVQKIDEKLNEILNNLTTIQDIYTDMEDYSNAKKILSMKKTLLDNFFV